MNTARATDIAPAVREVGLKITCSMIDWNSLVNPAAPNTPNLDATVEVARTDDRVTAAQARAG